MARRSLAAPITPSKTEDDYRTESDHSTLQRAEEVRADPSRMKRVAMFHRKKMGEMVKVGKRLGVAHETAESPATERIEERRVKKARGTGRARRR